MPTLIYHGHSNFEIHAAQYRIQIDPFYTGNPLADIPTDKPNPTHILLTHAHVDHVGDTLAIAARTNALVIANYEMYLYLTKLGVKNFMPMNHGGGVNLPFGRVTMTLAFHSSTFDDGNGNVIYGGQPAGFIIELNPESNAPKKTIYAAGDTALFSDMKLLGELYNIDLAALPIGDGFTMGPDHAIKAAAFLKTKKVLPIHYNTFPMIQQDPQKFAGDLKKQTGIDCAPLKPGQSIDL